MSQLLVHWNTSKYSLPRKLIDDMGGILRCSWYTLAPIPCAKLFGHELLVSPWDPTVAFMTRAWIDRGIDTIDEAFGDDPTTMRIIIPVTHGRCEGVVADCCLLSEFASALN